MIYIRIFFLFLTVLPLVSVAQQRMEEVINRRNRPLFFYELNTIPSDSNKFDYFFHFSISHDYLAFINTSSAAEKPVFKAVARLGVQVWFADSSFKQFSEDYSKSTEVIKDTQNRFLFLSGSFPFQSESIPVRYKIEVTDLNNNKQVFPRTIEGKIKALKIKGLYNTWVLEELDSAVVPVNLGKSVPFGKKAAIVFATSDSSGFSKITASLLQKNPGEKDYSLSDSAFSSISWSWETTSVSLSENVTHQISGIKPSLDYSQLDAGSYGLRIDLNGQVDTLFFAVNWLDMPYSLEDLDIATRVLKYIAPEKVYDELNSGGVKSRIRTFQAFWKEKDPTPATKYNELMHEYYRRVDFAYMNFASMKNPGWRTDRGKIFILHGSPESRNRETPPNRPPQEFWVYPNLKKTFLFVDLSGKGEYTLQAIR